MWSAATSWLQQLSRGVATLSRRPELLTFEVLEPRVLLSAKLLPGAAAAWPDDAAAAPPPDDRAEQNDTIQKATSLGTLKKPVEYSRLTINDDDWYKFTITQTGDLNDFVSIGFNHADGDIDLELYDFRGNKLAESRTVLDYERISLDGRLQGVYYLKVYGWRGATNPNYVLSISPANDVDQQHTVYANFDGAFLNRQDLERWENGQWLSGRLGLWDAGNDGITVSDYLAGRPDREAIITAVLKNLRSDLKPFGLQVVRHFGVAWENVGTTTLFLGASTLDSGGPNSASDVDVGNVNSTDIAFIGDQTNLWSASKDLIVGTSDAVLHEAGHTFGLAHVLSGEDKETMGLRLAFVNRDRWLENTAFLNKTYRLHNVPPGSFQNSYAVMKATFVTGLGSNLAVSQPALTFEDLDCTSDHHSHTVGESAEGHAAETVSPASAVGTPTPGWSTFESVTVGGPLALSPLVNAMPDVWDSTGSPRRVRGY